MFARKEVKKETSDLKREVDQAEKEKFDLLRRLSRRLDLPIDEILASIGTDLSRGKR